MDYSDPGRAADTSGVPAETDKCVSYFHQQTVGIFTGPNGHLLGTYDHLKTTQIPERGFKKNSTFWIYLLDLCRYLWQESSDKGPVLFIESLHNVGQTLQPGLRGAKWKTETPLRQRRGSESSALVPPVTPRHSHPLCWGRGVLQSFQQDDLQRLQI